MAVTRINNNQISDASTGNVYVGINASTKLQNYSVTAGKLANNLTYASDLTVTGNLTIQGNTTTVDTTYTTIEDPTILLASNQTGAPSVDIGFVGERGTANNIAFVWDESAAEFVTVFTSSAESNTTITITGYADIHSANANIGGNMVVNGTTSHVGNLIGNTNFTANTAAGNILTNGLISATGNVTGGNLNSGAQVVATANITGGNLLTSGIVSATSHIGSVVSVTGNITGGNINTGGLVSATGNIISAANVSGGNVLSSALVQGVTVSASGNVIGGNLTTAGLVTATGNVTSAANITGGNLLTSGIVSAASHIGSVVSVTGNVTGGNINSAANISATGNITASYYFGNGSQLTGVTASTSGFPVTAGTSNIAAATSGNIGVSVATTSNVLTIASTGIFTTGLSSVTGNITGANINTGGLVSATGNIISAANVSGGNVLSSALVQGVTLSATGNVIGGNITTAGQVSATGNITSAANIAGGNLLATTTVSAASYIGTTASLSGNVTGGNLLTGGLVSATGSVTSAANITGGNLLTSGIVSAASHIGSVVSVTGNVTGGNINSAANISATANVTASYYFGNGSQLTGVSASTSGFPVTAGTSNIAAATSGNIGVSVASTSNVLTIASTGIFTTGLSSVTGNITGGNLLTGGLVSSTGNVTSAANVAGGNVIATTLVSGASLFGTIVSASGNVTGGNINTGGLVSATGNVTSAANVAGANLIATTAVVTPTVIGTTVTVSSTGGLITLAPSSNVSVSSKNINNLAQPVQDQDAATKLYVDNAVSTQLAYHQGVTTATTTTLEVATGGTITYAQPNGAGNGVGATLTVAGGTFNLIDTANIQTANTRVMVKNQANAVLNGIYQWSNATVLTRTTDADTYGPNSSTDLSINDYFFVSSGNVNAGSAWIVDAPSGTITFGTSNIQFAQFSSSQTYSANTQAGISFSGTVISAKVDNNTTAFDGSGNIIVKAGANLTTPNIGAATGTSLSVTGNLTGAGGNISGNITGGNILTAGLISATGAITGATITGSTLSSTGNVVAVGVAATGNVTGGNLLTGGLISATSTITSAANITGGNITTAGQVSATGNITSAANVAGGNLIATTIVSGASHIGTIASLSGNVTGGNVNTGGLVSATGNITSAANITGGNLLATTTVSAASYIGTTASLSGNVTGGNLLTGGLISATGNITSAANVAGGNLIATTTVSAPSHIGTIVSVTGNVTAGGVTSSANMSAAGNITASYYFGNGSQLTGVTASTSGFPVTAGTSNIAAATNGNIGVSIAATSNVLTIASTGTFITGVASANGNITGGNLLTGGIVSSAGNIIGGTDLYIGSGASTTSFVNPIGIFRDNGTGYVQVAVINATGAGSADLVTYGNNGDDNQSWTDLGFNGNAFADSNYTITGAGDGYMLVQGNTSFGGNMVLATGNTGTTRDIVFSFGFLAANEFLRLQRSTNTILPAANLTANIGSTTRYLNNLYAANYIGTTASMTGNITGGNLLTGGLLSTTGNITSAANIAGGNLLATTTVSAASHIGSIASLSGNITGGNLITGGVVTATGNITSAANVSGGNVIATTTVSAASVIGTLFSASGNITGANINTGGTGGLILNGANINSNAARITINQTDSDVDFAVDGLAQGNVFYVDAGTKTASFGSSTQTTNAIIAMNATNSFLMPVGNTAQRPGTGVTGMLRFNSTLDAVEVYDADGWATVGTPSFTVISDQQFNGDGVTVAFTLAAAATTNSVIVSINGIVQIPTIAYSVSSTTLTFTEAPQTGDLIDVRNITTTTQVTSISNSPGNAVVAVNPTINEVNITGNLVPVSNAIQSLGSPTSTWKSLYVAGNTIYLGGLQLTASGSTFTVYQSDGTTPAAANTTINTTNNITVGGILNAGSNGVGNIGNSTTYFNTVFAKATSAQYADLAENYVADAEYAPGTVLSFGGAHEVTLTTDAGNKRIAGVVSTNPSYIMNSTVEGEFIATVALTGRVPTFVTGPVEKGDMMVSGGNGRAVACATPAIGSVIGKALENHTGGDGVIEVVVGRL